MVVVAICETGLQPSKLMPRAHLGDGRSNHGLVADAVKGDLPSTHEDVLEMIHQQVTLGVQTPNCIVCHQLEGLQLLYQGYNKKNRNHQEEHNEVK